MPGQIKFKKPAPVDLARPEHFSEEVWSQCEKSLTFDRFASLTTSAPKVWRTTLDHIGSAIEIKRRVFAAEVGASIVLAGDDRDRWVEALKSPDQWGIPFFMMEQALHFVEAIKGAEKA